MSLALKEKGNEFFKRKQYLEAIDLYSQAIVMNYHDVENKIENI